MQRMTDEQADLLQNIECALVTCARQNPQVDDITVKQALEACLVDRKAARVEVEAVADAVRHIRQVREDVPDGVWKTGLRVVLDSVRTHSSLQPGNTGHLSFVSQFIV